MSSGVPRKSLGWGIKGRGARRMCKGQGAPTPLPMKGWAECWDHPVPILSRLRGAVTPHVRGTHSVPLHLTSTRLSGRREGRCWVGLVAGSPLPLLWAPVQRFQVHPHPAPRGCHLLELSCTPQAPTPHPAGTAPPGSPPAPRAPACPAPLCDAPSHLKSLSI